MQIINEKEGPAVVVALDGRLDTQSAGGLESLLLKMIAAGERFFLIDCSAVDYMNSAGLKVFLQAAKRLSGPAKGRLVLCGLAPNVRMVFELTGFDALFEIKPSRAEALASFG
jgi:anti-anti-sigma factor